VSIVTPVTGSENKVSAIAELGHFLQAWQRYVLYLTLVLVMVFFAVVRVRLRNAPLQRDEGEFAYSGQLMLEGIPPYKLAYNMKLPGTYAAYAASMAVFGQTASGIRLGVMLVNAATAVLVFLLAKRLHGRLAGVLAGCTFALLSTRSSVFGFQAHDTNFVIFAAIAGILLLLYATDAGRTAHFFASGLLLGLGILTKQHGIVLALFAGLYLLWTQRRARIPDLTVRAATFSAGVVLPYLLTCLVLYRKGVFRSFWFWTFSYGRAYVSETSMGEAWQNLHTIVPWIVRPFLIWGIAAVGLTALAWNKKVRDNAPFTVGFLLFSIFAVIPGFYFRAPYFILLLPAVALWTGIGVAAVYDRLQQSRWAPQLNCLPLIIFAVAFAFSIHGQRKFFFRSDPIAALLESNLCGDTCVADVQVADYLEANSSPQDQIAVLGSEPAIYFYSHRHSATGYIYTYALSEKQKYVAEMRQEMMAEVERAHPKFVVYADDGYSWWNLGSSKDVSYVAPLLQWVSSNYQLDKRVVLAADVPPHRGDHAAFYVFRRKN